MLVQGVNLPEELLRAQAAGDLVVFAGAGISAPPPSSLPLFDELAAQVGKGTGIMRGSEESTDHYFGRLKLGGVEVHKAVARILLQPESKHHELHTLLTQLFPSGTSMRIVTTNFDDHFSTAVQAGIGASFETFYAPALPLGDDFTGLVYLHGSVAKNPQMCVLTDEDFGRAYLTRAWATRFLSAMFERYAVLFVGYSHGDPVMNYLARGLSPAARKPRYAFTTEDIKSIDSWTFLGVHQIVYPRDAGANGHGAIIRCVRDWVRELHRGLLDKVERIRAISDTQPPLEGEDADYLKFCLGSIETARIFFRHASTPDWISWLEKHGFFARFFDWRQSFGEFERELGFWLIARFFVDYAQEVLAVIERHGSRIHAEFAWRLWHRLIRRDHNANIDPVFSVWTALLLTQPQDVLSSDDWSMLLGKCRLPEDAAVATQLFVNITRPRLKLKEHWRFRREDADSQKVEFEVNLLDDNDHYLANAWANAIRPHLDTCAPRLALPVFANLAAADNLARVDGSKYQDTDPFWIHRQSIGGNVSRASSTTLNHLINAARDLVIHRTVANPKDVFNQTDALFASNVPVLQRLAVYSIGQAERVSADDKVNWLLEHTLLYRHKADVFRFLEVNYSNASDELRRRVVETVVAGPKGGRIDGVHEETLLYERFNFLVWLGRVAPQCHYVRDALEVVRGIKPDFQERDRPDLDFWPADARWLDAREAFNIEEITSQAIGAFLAARPAPVDEGYFDNQRSRYTSSISAAAREKPQWGLELLKELVSCGLNDADLWSSVTFGIRDAKLSSSQWAAFLEFAQSAAVPCAFFEAATEVLEHGSRREMDGIPDELMPAAQRVADRIWCDSLSHTTSSNRQLGDWLSEAINRPGGKLAEFWLRRVSVAKASAGQRWTVIPPDIAQSIRRMIVHSSEAGAHARVVIASQLHYFFSVDPAFAQAELLPLFDWSRDATTAEQCWHGFLIWGRWLPGFTDQLLPSFDEIIRRTQSQPEDIRRAIIAHITELALYRLDDPLSNGWLPNVVRMLGDEDL
ncbi:MAG TPA: SIR2 family protein, partial [Bryobacteraceae bacterium]|nr:SIR2 family protein [Bryobacteraceae bacterium]